MGIKKQKKDNIEFVRQLMKKNSKSLGFIPIIAAEKASNENRLFIYSEQNKKIGYLMFGPINEGKDVAIWQICVDEKNRRKGIGKKLFNMLLSQALANRAKGIRLRCASDLPANYFWKSLGFDLALTVNSKSKKKKISIYYFPLINLF